MAKANRQGKGVRPTNLMTMITNAADELFVHADAVVIIAVRFSGTHDGDENIARASRGSQIVVGKAIDLMCEYDESKIQIEDDDDSEEDE